MLTSYSLGWDKNFAFIAYDEDWREHRRLFHTYFNQTVVKNYRPAILTVAEKMLVQLYENPESFMDHFRLYIFVYLACRPELLTPTYRMTGSMILRITYGLDVRSADDPLIVTADKALQSLAKFGNSGSSLGTPDVRSSPGIRSFVSMFSASRGLHSLL